MAYKARTARLLITLEIERLKAQRAEPRNMAVEEQEWIRGRISGLRQALEWIEQFGPVTA